MESIIDRLPWPALGPVIFILLAVLVMVLLMVWGPQDKVGDIAFLIVGAALTRVKFAGTADTTREDTNK